MIDLFEVIVRLMAVKPLVRDEFDFEEAQEVIKKERASSIMFTSDHFEFERIMDAMTEKISQSVDKKGVVYIYVKGQGCTDRFKKKLLELSMKVNKIVIFGDPKKWPVLTINNNISFTQSYDILADNHQRFFIYASPSFNIALVARHHLHDGEERTEAIVTNAADAVSMAAQTLGTKIQLSNN